MRTISYESKIVSGRNPLSVDDVFKDPDRLTKALAHLPDEETEFNPVYAYDEGYIPLQRYLKSGKLCCSSKY